MSLSLTLKLVHVSVLGYPLPPDWWFSCWFPLKPAKKKRRTNSNKPPKTPTATGWNQADPPKKMPTNDQGPAQQPAHQPARLQEYQLDKGLLQGLLKLLPRDASVADFGAGAGQYAKWLNDTGARAERSARGGGGVGRRASEWVAKRLQLLAAQPFCALGVKLPKPPQPPNTPQNPPKTPQNPPNQ